MSEGKKDLMCRTGLKVLLEELSKKFAKKEEIPTDYLKKESDPTVPLWAKQETKPTYTAEEVGALNKDTPLFSGNYDDLKNKPSIPSKTTDLTNDSNYQTDMDLKKELDPIKDDIESLRNNPSVDETVLEKLAIKDTQTGNPCVISDSADWNIKDLKVYGETTQVQEENVVPTPERPVPIISKKIKVGDEYVELKSLKETGNLLFDDSFGWSKGYVDNSSGLIVGASHTNNEVYCDFQPIKPNTIYGILIQTSLEGSTDNLQWCGVGLYDENKSFIKRETISEKNVLKSSRLFTTPSNAKYFRFSYRKYTDGVAMLIETNVNPTNYIAPTVRDYKIVDHETKTSKIIRNIKYVTFNGSEDNWYYDKINGNRFHIVIENSISSIKPGRNEALANIGHFSNDVVDTTTFTFENNLFIYTKHLSLDEFKEFLSTNNLEAQYQLKDQIEEQIPYDENDTDDYGYSYQESKIPSISIPSPIISKEVSEIKLTGKNLFDFSKILEETNYEIDYENKTITIQANTNNGGYINGFKDFTVKAGETYVLNAKTSAPKAQRHIYLKDTKKVIRFGESFTLTDEDIKSTFSWYNDLTSDSVNIISEIQLEIGSVATSYEPYKEQHVTFSNYITLSSTLDKKVTDVIDVNSGLIRRKIKTLEITGTENFINDYQNQLGYYGRYFDTRDGNVYSDIKVACNMLPHVYSSWSKVSEGFSQNGIQLHFKFSNERLGITDETPLADKRVAFANFIKQLYASGNPLTVLYCVNETTEPLPLEDKEKIKALKMYYPNTIVHTGVSTEVEYIADTKLYIDKKLQPLNTVQSKLLEIESKV